MIGPAGELSRTLGRYADAAGHMRLGQVVGRARRAVPPRVLAMGLGDAESPTWLGLADGLGATAAPQSGPQPPPDRTGVFRAVGAQRTWGTANFWTDSRDGLLFLFCLHDFAMLAAYAAGERSPEGDRFWSAVLSDWLERCDRPSRVAWHPYPVSGRLIAWCAALSSGGWGEGLEAAMRRSAWRQGRMLARCVEHDIGGNHVLHNAAALVIAGSCLGDSRLKRRGLRVFERELPTQILHDGGHEERSPAYHRVVHEELTDVCETLRRAGDPVPAHLEDVVGRMADWLRAIAAPDGSLPRHNDAWDGPAVADDGRDGVRELSASGFVVLRHAKDQAILDVGPLAPAHLPAHAHADALAFGLWVDGSPVVVDPGAYHYGPPDRNEFRGTAAHATVTIGDRDQCDFWAPFRAAHLPRIRRIPVTGPAGTVAVAAEHDGYAPARHRRVFWWLPGEGLVIWDELTEPGISRLPLAPGLRLGATGAIAVAALGEGEPPTAVDARVSPYLGVAVGAQRLERKVGRRSGWALVREGTTVTVEPGRLVAGGRSLTLPG